MYVRDAVFTGTNASMTPGYADLGSDIMVLRLGFHSPGFLPSRRPEMRFYRYARNLLAWPERFALLIAWSEWLRSLFENCIQYFAARSRGATHPV